MAGAKTILRERVDVFGGGEACAAYGEWVAVHDRNWGVEVRGAGGGKPFGGRLLVRPFASHLMELAAGGRADPPGVNRPCQTGVALCRVAEIPAASGPEKRYQDRRSRHVGWKKKNFPGRIRKWKNL